MEANFDKNIEKISNTDSHKVKTTKKKIPSYNSVQQDLPTDKGASRSYVIGGISFGAMKKPQFSGFDLLVVNKFKAPIEKFNTNDDLQNWCKEQIDELSKKDLKGRQAETTTQREATFKEWSDYVLKKNDAYTNSIALLILDGILKDINPDNDTEIPPLNKGGARSNNYGYRK